MKHSIRTQMIFWLVLVLGSITLARITFGIYQANYIANELYDEQLSNSADSCAARLEEAGGVITSSLPPNTLETFTHSHKDQFYYEVFTEQGVRLAGNTDILQPMLTAQTEKHKRFSSLDRKPEPLRLLQIRISVPEASLKHVIVITAETLHARRAMATRIVTNVAISQLLVVSASIAMVLIVTNAVFAPLSRLRATISSRSSSDLSPISDSDAPEDVRPLINAINDLLARSRNEIESRNRFIANAAHQLRTPIAGLKTYSSFGLRLNDINEIQNLLAKVDLGLDRVTHLMNQLLAMTRVEHLKLIPVDLSAIVAERIDEYKTLADEKEIELCYPQAESKEPLIINGDATGLRDLTANLIENSLRYCSKHGRVAVSLKNGDTSITLTVEDDGPGIPVEDREQVFERFYRIPGSAGDGCGLGLAIVWEVVQAHQAKITIKSPESGQGTVVIVEFPKFSATPS